MQYLIFIGGLVGVGMFIYGVKILYKIYTTKDILQFNLNDNLNKIIIYKEGYYSINLIGGFGIISNPLNVIINSLNEKEKIVVTSNSRNYTFLKKWKRAIELYQFEIKSIGEYEVSIKNYEKLILKKSQLKIYQFFEKKQKISNIKVLIKETVPNSIKIKGIICLTLGANIGAWGIILGINPQIFG